MRFIKLMYIVSLVLPISSYGAMSEEQLLSQVFKGLETHQTVSSDVDRYGAIYTTLIKQKLGDLDEHSGQECRTKLRLSNSGNVEQVDLADQGKLCRKVFNAVWEVGSFPMPSDENEASKLRELFLTVTP